MDSPISVSVRADVLLVGVAAEAAPKHPLGAGLARLGRSVQGCPDVHRALARLGRPDADQPCAVLVCVDDLDPREFEFFRHVQRMSPALPMYVFSDRQQREKLALTVRAGATAAVNATTLSRIRLATATSQATGPAERDPAAADQPGGPPRFRLVNPVREDAVEAPGASDADASEALFDALDGLDEAAGDDSTCMQARLPDRAGPVVPWIASQRRPQRMPPPPPTRSTKPVQPGVESGLTPEEPTPRPAEGLSTQHSPEPPLLGAHELALLIGEDHAPQGRRKPEGPSL